MMPNRPYIGYLDRYRHLIDRYRAQGLSRLEVCRRLYDYGVRPPQCLFVQPRCPEIEREPMARAMECLVRYMERHDAFVRRVTGWGVG